MWRRLKRMVQANLGRLTPGGGTAADALKRQADDLARELPAIDANLATIRAECAVSEEKLRRLRWRDEELVSLVAAAQGRGSLERAAEYTTELAGVRRQVVDVEAHLARVRTAIDAAGRTKDAVRAARERKLEEVREVARNLAELEREDALRTSTTEAVAAATAGSSSLGGEVVVPGPLEPKVERPMAQKTLGPPEPAALLSPQVSPGTEPRMPGGPAASSPEPGPSGKTFGPAAAMTAQAAPATLRPLEIKVRPVMRGASDPTAAPALDARVPADVSATRTDDPPAFAPRGDLVDELERLGRLRSAGALTDEELALAKKKLLGGASARPTS